MTYHKKFGFTLAEVIIVLVVSGIVAVLTIPGVVNKYKESQARMKVKKSMAAYDTAISKMVIENDLRSVSALKEWAESDDCANSVEYFKKVERNGCIFKTSDGVYWDIEDITNPIIAMSENALQDAKENGTDGKKSFKLVTSYDEMLGTFRVDDLGFEKKRLEDEILQAGEPTSEIEEKIEELEKLFGFALNIENKVEQSPFASCSEFPCEVNGLSWKGKIQISQAEADGAKITNRDMCSWDPKEEECIPTGGSEVKIIVEDLFISDNLTLTEDEAKSAENCDESRYEFCAEQGDYWNLARRKCEAAGGRLPTGAELKVMLEKGQLVYASYYWTYEASSDTPGKAYYFRPNRNSAYSSNVSTRGNKAVCVGK